MSLDGPSPGYAFELFTEIRNSATDHAPIRFELGLPGTSKPQPPTDTGKVGPHSLQPGQQVLKLRQFDLHLGFARTSTGGEDVENELGTIQDPNTEAILEGLALRRCELVVEDYEIRFGASHALPKLIDLALPDVEAWMGGVDSLADDVDDLTTGGVSQPGQLIEVLLSDDLIEALQGSPNEHGPIHRKAVVDQPGRNDAS